MNQERIKEILGMISNVRVAVYGDFCLDAYWIMDPAGSEISLETGKQAEAVGRHYYSPGGAANIAANLAALKPAAIKAIGVAGNDLFGRELKAQLHALKIDTSSIIIQNENFDTYTFTKKYRDEEEEPRIDFGIFNIRSKETDELLVAAIRDALQHYDVLIFNQQFPGSITHPEFIDRVNEIFSEFSHKIVLLDSRHYNDRFRHVFRKVNALEIARMNGLIFHPEEKISMKKTGQFAEKVFRQSRKPVFVSCGEKGIISCDDQGVHEIRGLSFLKRLDTVGAGDTVMSALALSLACGISPEESAAFANFAAAVTVQKIFTTGTASGEEILAVAADPDFVFRPDLADGLADAEYLPGSQIEICDGDFIRGKTSARHAVFDHDGTISTLRRGWEQVMEKIMIDAITAGAGIERVRAFLPRIRGRVREYIEKSTGVQTILQMQALVEMVREFDLADAEQRSDKSGYKKIYNQALSDHIRNRLTLVRENLFMRDDYTISGAVPFMKELRNRGVKLYLASGTDKQYVEEEAAIMGYADLFDGGIYGALDDVTRFSKKMVIENIIKSNSLKGDELVVFGDGPVEIRESIKQGGLAIGVATDEERMTGINQRKRTRLIKAGAQLIISDFGEYEKLIELLTGS